jgi:hypothetical protein
MTKSVAFSWCTCTPASVMFVPATKGRERWIAAAGEDFIQPD